MNTKKVTLFLYFFNPPPRLSGIESSAQLIFNPSAAPQSQNKPNFEPKQTQSLTLADTKKTFSKNPLSK
jgi:hypothetical protein